MPGYNDELVVYDTSCGAPFSDDKEAADLLADLGKDCDSDCTKAGSQWSVAFVLNAIVCTLIITNMICVCVGSRVPISRLIASCCACCICCFHVATIIVTAVFRFRNYGQYCALS